MAENINVVSNILRAGQAEVLGEQGINRPVSVEGMPSSQSSTPKQPEKQRRHGPDSPFASPLRPKTSSRRRQGARRCLVVTDTTTCTAQPTDVSIVREIMVHEQIFSHYDSHNIDM